MITTHPQVSVAAPNLPAFPGAAHRNVDAPIHLALVDDDDDFREVVSSELEDFGFAVHGFQDSPALLDHFQAGCRADVIVLDWDLPSIVGIDLVPILQGRGILAPVIILTGHGGPSHEVEALERGAVDFIDKARGTQILAKRAQIIGAAQHRARAPTTRAPLGDGLTLRATVCRAYWHGTDVDLTMTEFDIVAKLATASGEHVSYRAIYDCVHHCGFIAGNGEDGFRTNVRSSIKRIRNKFRAIDPSFSAIENFPGYGYRWKNASNRDTVEVID